MMDNGTCGTLGEVSPDVELGGDVDCPPTKAAVLVTCGNVSRPMPFLNVSTEVPIEYAQPMLGYAMPFLLVVTIIANTLIVVVLSKRHMRTPTNVVLMAMALSDMLTLLFPAPWLFYMYTFGNHYKPLAPISACYAYHIMNEVSDPGAVPHGEHLADAGAGRAAVRVRVPRAGGAHLVHHAARAQGHRLDRGLRRAAPVDALRRHGVPAVRGAVARAARRARLRAHAVAARRGRHARRLLRLLLHVPRRLRAHAALHLARRPQRAALQGHARRPGPPQDALPGEPQERVPEAARLQLHDADADRGRDGLPAGRDPAGGRHHAAHHLEQRHRDPRLLRRQRAGALHQLLHHRQLPHQLRHLLRHVAPVPRDLQGAVRARRRRGPPQRRQLQVLARQRAAHLHQRDRAVTTRLL